MFIVLEISSVEKLALSSESLISFARLLGKTLMLFNRVHWFAKKALKSSAFSFKFVKQRRETEEVHKEAFVLFRKVFKMDQ